MSIPPFLNNKVVWFRTSYNQGRYRNFLGYRCYLLFSVDEKFLNFFPITSNRVYFVASKYKVSEPRPPCLESEIYLESFVNTSILVKVPFEAISYLEFCKKCSVFCLKDFKEITKLHFDLAIYKIKVDGVKLVIGDFEKPKIFN